MDELFTNEFMSNNVNLHRESDSSSWSSWTKERNKLRTQLTLESWSKHVRERKEKQRETNAIIFAAREKKDDRNNVNGKVAASTANDANNNNINITTIPYVILSWMILLFLCKMQIIKYIRNMKIEEKDR